MPALLNEAPPSEQKSQSLIGKVSALQTNDRRQDGGDVGGCVFALQGNKGEVVI